MNIENHEELNSALENYYARQKGNERENNGQNTESQKEKSFVERATGKPIDDYLKEAKESQINSPKSAKDVTFHLSKTPEADEKVIEKQHIEIDNTERNKMMTKAMLDKLNDTTEKNPKRMAIPDKFIAFSKRSIKELDIPRDSLNSMRIMHYAHILIPKFSDFRDLENPIYGNERDFECEGQYGMLGECYVHNEKKYFQMRTPPLISTLHGFCKPILGKSKMRGREYHSIAKVFNSKEAKEKVKLDFYIKHYGKVTAEFSRCNMIYLPDRKHAILCFHPAFYDGLTSLDRRILQKVPQNIFDIIKKVYRKISGKKFVGKVAELALLNFFYRVIQINNQDKSGHNIRDKELVFSQRTKPQERKDIMSHVAETFANEDVKKLIYGQKLNGNIVEFSTKKFIGTNNTRHLSSK